MSTAPALATPGFDGDALAMAAAIVAGEFSAVQAMERTLAAAAQANLRLNALVRVQADRALAGAAALDAELAACRSDAERHALHRRRPFFGVPLALKDIGAATAHPDFPSTMGSRVFDGLAGEGRRGYPWPAEGTLLARYRAAGFVPFARSTVPEMGISASTEARANGGPTRNPHAPDHSAGGSSGGAAALTAAGVVPLAHANDGAGSIRIPASACGLWGLKPSRGLMPMGPLVGEVWGGMATDHVVSRTLRDTAAVLDASAGADPGSPYAAPALPAAAGSSYLRLIGEAPAPQCIALCNRFFEGDPVHPEVAAAVAAVARRLEAAGHTVEEAAPPFATRDVVEPLMRVVASGVAQALDGAGRLRGRPVEADDVEPSVWGAYRVGRELPAARFLDAMAALHLLARRMAAFHQRYPLLLTPVLAEPPALLGRFAMHNPDFIDYRLGPQGLWRYSPFTPLANATGAPSLAVPAGRSASGLPLGAMLSAALGEDALLLRVAAQLT